MLAAVILAVGLAGCPQHVKKDEPNAAIQQKQQDQQPIDAIKQQMPSQVSGYDSQINAMQGCVSMDIVAQFASNSAELSNQDKPALHNFVQTISKYHPNVVITVEGFADPAGSRAYNNRVSMKRAEVVRDFLVYSGTHADQIRAVRYGKDANRQVVKGATRNRGADNRRVSLTVDSTGDGAMASAASTS